MKRKWIGSRDLLDRAGNRVLDVVRPRLSRVRQARSGDLLVVDVHCWEGMFVHLEWFLEMAVHCERLGLRPCFMSSSPPYVDRATGPDWYAYFFSNPQLTAQDAHRIRHREVPVCRIAHIGQLGLPCDYDAELSLATAPGLVRKYIGIRPEVVDKVEAFVTANLQDKTVLGIHYRGTDKRLEAPRLSYRSVFDAIDRYLARHAGFDCLFVSSDEQDFVDEVTDAFGTALPVVSHRDQQRSRDRRPVHHSPVGDRFQRGEEAVVNCLLLSRCAALIKTPSILSGWSKLFNPALEVTMLASPFDRHLWFPDRDLVKNS